MASLSNAAATGAIEPIISAMSCNFTKLSVDLPLNTRPTTILAVISCMMLGSHVYDNKTVALIHNMFVGMVMLTDSRVLLDDTMVEFTKIRNMSELSELMSTKPYFGKLVGYKRHLEMLKFLSYFHGLKVKSKPGKKDTPEEVSKIVPAAFDGMWDRLSVSGPNNVALSVDQDNLLNSYENYFSYFGPLSNGCFENNVTCVSRLATVDSGHNKLTENILGSTFDVYDYDEDRNDPNNLFPKSVKNIRVGLSDKTLSNMLLDHDDEGYHVHNLFWRGLQVKMIKKDVDPDVLMSERDLEEQTDGKFCVTLPLELTGRISMIEVMDTTKDYKSILPSHLKVKNSDKYYVPQNELTLNLDDDDIYGCVRVRPIHRRMIDMDHYTDCEHPNNTKAKTFLRSVVKCSEDLSSGTDWNYVPAIMKQTTTDRFLDLSQYLTEMASITTLADYAPASYTSLIYSSDDRIDLSDPLSHRESAHNIKLISVVDGSLILFSNGDNGYLKLEPQNNHRKIKIEWSSIAALNLLGVAPPGGPEISGVMDIISDSKAFNHDIAMMKYGVSVYNDWYNNIGKPSFNKLNSEGSTAKVSKLKGIFTMVRNTFPVTSNLTSKVEESLNDGDLRQNQFWKSSPFVDCDGLPIDFGTYEGGGVIPKIQLWSVPFLRTRPLTSMYDSCAIDGTIAGKQDFHINHLFRVVFKYLNSPVSMLGQCSDVILSKNSFIDNSVSLTRTNGASATIPIGQPYIPESIMDSPMVQLSWTYSDNMAEMMVYDSLSELLDGRNGIKAGRTHKMIFNEFMNNRIDVLPNPTNTAFGALTSIVYRNNCYFKLNFSKASDILHRAGMIKIPEIVNFKLDDLSLDLTYTVPEQYVSKEDEIKESRITPYHTIPVIPHNVGPFISRLENRSSRWPARGDYTVKGALTENIRSQDFSYCEYNLQAIGVVMNRKHQLILSDPDEYIVVSLDPMAIYTRT
jgi:hypothetical protein